MFLNESINFVACTEQNSLVSEVFSTGRQHYSPRTCVWDGERQVIIQGESCHWQLVRESHESWTLYSEKLSTNLHTLHCFTQHPTTTTHNNNNNNNNNNNSDFKLLLTEQPRNFLYLFPSYSQTEANSEYGTESCKYDFCSCP